MSVLALYRLATRLGGPLFELALQRRVRQAREDPARLAERRGRASAPRPAGPLVWLHAASVGEALAVLPLLEALLAARPTLQALITTGTVTSARLMAERLPARARHQFVPLDRPAAWRAFLDHWRPQLALLVESELWPNLILESRRRGVPLALINAPHVGALAAALAARCRASRPSCSAGFELCLAQSAADRDRFARARRRARCGRSATSKPAAPPLPAPARRSPSCAPLIGGAAGLARRQHPSRRGQRCCSTSHRQLSRAGSEPADDHRAAPSRARRGARRLARSDRGIAVARRSRRERARAGLRASISPTRWASSACSTAWRRSPSSASRWCRAAARTRSRRRGSAARCCSGRTWPTSRSWRRACCGRAARRQVADGGELAAAVAAAARGSARPRAQMAERAPRRGGRARPACSARRSRRWRRCSSGPSARPMRAPEFWAERRPPAPGCWRPARAPYGLAGRLRRRWTVPRRAPVPAICVGNLTVGGAGKTPVALALAERLLAGGRAAAPRDPRLRRPRARPAAGRPGAPRLRGWSATRRCCSRRSRRPGSRATGSPARTPRPAPAPSLRDPRRRLPEPVGWRPTSALRRDRRRLWLRQSAGCCPAGPLREPVADGLRRADAVIRIGADARRTSSGCCRQLCLASRPSCGPRRTRPTLAGRRRAGVCGNWPAGKAVHHIERGRRRAGRAARLSPITTAIDGRRSSGCWRGPRAGRRALRHHGQGCGPPAGRSARPGRGHAGRRGLARSGGARPRCSSWRCGRAHAITL